MSKYIFLFLAISTIQLFSQRLQLSKWEAYTSMYDVNSIYEENGKIYVATSGGVYFADIDNNEITTFTNVTGLSSIDARFITYDRNSDKVFVGYSNGTFDIYASHRWTPIYDIKNAGFTNANINDILVVGDKLYIAGGFGLVVFDHNKNVTIEDVKRIADFQQGTEIRAIKLHNNKIWVATSSGVAYTDFDNSLANRYDWKTIVPAENFMSSDIRDIEWINDSLYATSGDYIYSWDGEKLVSVMGIPTKDILGLNTKNNELYYFKERSIRKYPDDTEITKTENFINNFRFDKNSSDIYIATNAGVKIVRQDTTINIEPNTPLSNGIADIHVSENGDVWVGTGRITNKGIMSFIDGEWAYYNSKNYPDFLANTVIRVNELKDGTIAASTYGGGLYLLKRQDSTTITNINTTNSPLIATDGAGKFTITGDVFEDFEGNMWIVDWGNFGNGPLFVVRKSDGGFETLYNCKGSNKRTLYKMALDFNGTKWVGSSGPDVSFYGSEKPVGLAYYNEMGTLSDKSDDICGMLTTSNSDMTNNYQTAVAFDKQGTLWLGSISGVNRVINPSAVMNGNTPIIINIRSMDNQSVREIVVDALDNKWIATANGLFVLDPDGEKVLYNINTDNSPLPTNILLSLEYDKNSGKMYIGTDKGMYSVQTSAVKPLPEYNLQVYPQPFDPNKDNFLTIDGLAENSDLRIVTIDGELVRKIKVNSRTTNWDGRNEQGAKVSTGVYLLYAVSSTNESTEVIKIAVINK